MAFQNAIVPILADKERVKRKAQQLMNPHILIIDADASAAYITRMGVQRIAPEATCLIEQSTARDLSELGIRPDVVIVDPPHHTLAGSRLIQNLKQAYPEAHVIVLASAPTPILRRDMHLLGVEAYLEKPAPLAELAVALRTSLQRLSLAQTEHLPFA
jgi:DNA-binding NarL/FixJ family response regulator